MENWLKVTLIILVVIIIAVAVLIIARYIMMKPYYDFIVYKKSKWQESGEWDAINTDRKKQHRDMIIALTLNKDEADTIKALAKLHEIQHPEDAGKYTREKDFVSDDSEDN